MYIAPLLYAFSGAWNYSNQQLFVNKVVTKVDTSYYPKTDHFITQQWQQLTPGTPFAILLVILGIMNLYYYIRSYVSKKKGDQLYELKEQPAVQNLADYFMHLKDKDIESWIKEEVVGKERLNFERLN